MATWGKGKEDVACETCEAIHVVEWADMPDKDRSSVRCLVPGCGGIVIETKGTRDWGPAKLKDQPHA